MTKNMASGYFSLFSFIFSRFTVELQQLPCCPVFQRQVRLENFTNSIFHLPNNNNCLSTRATEATFFHLTPYLWISFVKIYYRVKIQ